MMNKKIVLVMSSIAILVLVIVPVVYFFSGLKRPGVNLAFQQKIAIAGHNAFGALTFSVQSGAEKTSGQSASLSVPSFAQDNAASAPAIASNAPTPAVGFGGGVGGGVAVGGSAIAYPVQFADYTYKYTGEPLNLTDDKVTVFKRELTGDLGRQLGGIFSGVNLGFIDLGSFKNPQLQNMLLSEGATGYDIAVGVKDENVYINRSQSYWNAMYSACPDQSKCAIFNGEIKPGDIPADSELIAIANKFFADHGINKSIYGEPFVNHDQPIYYAMGAKPAQPATDMPIRNISPSISIIYPLTIKGLPVYDESANPAGITVNINMSVKEVFDVSGLNTQNYAGSDYDGVTNAAEVIKIAENGGLNYYHPEAAAKIETLDLDTPTRGLVRQWKYENNQSYEIFVPSLIFKVKNPPTSGYWYPRTIVIPLVKELLTEQNNGGRPIPMIKGVSTPPSPPSAAIPPTKAESAPANR